MSPVPGVKPRAGVMPKPTGSRELIVEAWAHGYLVGSLIIMCFITIANMRRSALLHKLVLGMWQSFWLFFKSPIHAWWLSVAAIPLNASWSLHNVIAWMKIRPFLSKHVSRLYIITVIMAQPYWVLEIYANFTYFHDINTLFLKTRPWEALCRDPWWIFTTIYLFIIIKTQYEMTFQEIIRISPRFAVMLLAMMLSMIFILLDIFAVTKVLRLGGSTGINPFWKLAFVFKCLTDSVVLDDFKMALDRLRVFKLRRLSSFSANLTDEHAQNNSALMAPLEHGERTTKQEQGVHTSTSNPIHLNGFSWKPEQIQKTHKDSVASREHVHWHDPSMVASRETTIQSLNEESSMHGRGNTSPSRPQTHGQSVVEPASLQKEDEDDETSYAEAVRQVQCDNDDSHRRQSGAR